MEVIGVRCSVYRGTARGQMETSTFSIEEITKTNVPVTFDFP